MTTVVYSCPAKQCAGKKTMTIIVVAEFARTPVFAMKKKKKKKVALVVRAPELEVSRFLAMKKKKRKKMPPGVLIETGAVVWFFVPLHDSQRMISGRTESRLRAPYYYYYDYY
jgi:hypothetical protein